MAAAPSKAVETESGQRELLERFQAGDASAFGKVMRSHSASIYSYLGRCGVTPSERDDLFQEIFCRAHRAAGRFEPDRPIKPWLFTIAVNTVRTHFSRSKPDNVVSLEFVAEPEGRGHSPQQELEGQEMAQWLEAELVKLPNPERDVLLMCSIHGMAQKEVAEILAMPVNTIKTHLRRARLSLARAMARRRLQQDREVTR